MLNDRQFGELANQLRTQGGFTVDVNTGSQPSSGVAVAIPGHEESVPTASGNRLRTYATQHADVLRQPGHHFGGWDSGPAEGAPPTPAGDPYAPEAREGSRAQLLHNVDVLDVSKVIPEHPRGHHIADVHHAMHVNRQDASFDLRTGATIPNPRAPYQPGPVTDEYGSSVTIKRKR